MAYSFKIEKLDGTFRGCTHQAVIYWNGERISSHRTRLGKEAAEKEARSTIKFYEKRSGR